MNLFRRKPKYALLSGKWEDLDFVGHYDLGLLNYRSKAKYPYMLGISIQGFETDARKLPTNKARPAIDDFEDLLTRIVEKSTKSIYAGHTFWNGALEVIFYIDDYMGIVKVLEQEANKKHELTFTFKIDSDPMWEQLNHLAYTN